MKSFFLAWQFLTIFPWRSEQEIDPRLLGWSMAFYQMVGLLLGLMLWGFHWTCSWVFPRALGDGLVVMLLSIITGGLHLDGLADTCDGMASGKSPEERMKIMKDHRVGTFGVVGLILILGMKYLALNSLPDKAVGPGLLLALILGRWSMVQLTYRAPYARQEGGLGLPFKENLRKKDVILAAVSSLILTFSFWRFWGLFLFLLAGVFTLFFQKFFEKRIGGITGDVLGAGNEVNEVVVLVALHLCLF